MLPGALKGVLSRGDAGSAFIDALRGAVRGASPQWPRVEPRQFAQQTHMSITVPPPTGRVPSCDDACTMWAAAHGCGAPRSAAFAGATLTLMPVTLILDGQSISVSHADVDALLTQPLPIEKLVRLLKYDYCHY